MRIYQVVIEHVRWGRNFTSTRIAARTCAEAIRKAKSEFQSRNERVESVQILAESD